MRIVLGGLALLLGCMTFATDAAAQVVVYRPAPTVVYRPAPVVAPVPRVTYYAPAPQVTYYAPAPRVTYYAPQPTTAYYAPTPVAAAPYVPAYVPVRRALFPRRFVYYPGYVPAW